MTHTPICTCRVDVAQRDETDPAAWSPVVFRVDHCPLHRAAPELLEACYKALDGMYDQFPQYETATSTELSLPDMDCYATEVILQIRAAIAKAEGVQ